MVSGNTFTALKGKGNLLQADDCEAVGQHGVSPPFVVLPQMKPFLRIPPFPGARVRHFLQSAHGKADGRVLADKVREYRVGGTYWAAQPELPAGYVLARSTAAVEAAKAVFDGRVIICWNSDGVVPNPSETTPVIPGACDPWHMASSAAAVVVERPDDELRVIAALIGIPVYLCEAGRGDVVRDTREAGELLDAAIGGSTFLNPFTGENISAGEAVELCAFWRRLVDSNRDISSGLGFAFWKQSHVAPLLWNGGHPIHFVRTATEAPHDGSIATWQSKVAPQDCKRLEQSGRCIIEVEDGFLRSRGLGADCIPPLSLTVDRLGAHFDPSRPSELERLIQYGTFDDELLTRAAELRRLIVAVGLGKYESGAAVIDRPAGDRRHVLVPGQVEDDRAVTAGGCGLTSNLELLKRVREQAPDSYILYKPHPDVLAGHRRGAVPDRICLDYADTIVGDQPIGSLIAMVDGVHVNTSLAGFEALLRGKEVTTYGVPFYAGWGLTRDFGAVPRRRTARRTVDELVAASLLSYPRYLDPVTGLPCPAEVVVARLCDDGQRDPGLLVGVRRLQGKFMRRFRSLVQ